ncbi:MAG: hypothetical protein LKJ94_01950 [Candidatus Methanomethylophilus sp.]|jgi:acetyltransferase-like isoleucine patch superfamily enzyme|nr:hypothetical protein [Methanomethylophilus sp.]MCI2074462.1 hypothetical protein [Methanomethylophilus sp.]MCI2093861.1 hypothetical protein [Methanomethylophilus sp.]
MANIIRLHSDEKVEEVKPSDVKGLKITFNKGSDNNIIDIFEPTNFVDSSIFIQGSKNTVYIDSSIYRRSNLTTSVFDFENECRIGKNLYCDHILIVLSEIGNKIIIGEDCMFSSNIMLRVADGHTIYDINTKLPINKPKRGIQIGSHVWICRNVTILKDSGCGSNDIIGCGSILTKYYPENNIILAGNPARIVKINVNWDRRNLINYENSLNKK